MLGALCDVIINQQTKRISAFQRARKCTSTCCVEYYVYMCHMPFTLDASVMALIDYTVMLEAQKRTRLE